MLHKLIIIIFAICYSVEAVSQKMACFHGNVYDENNIPIEYFNVLLLSRQDSSLISGDVFYDGKFEIKNIVPQTYICRVINIQYEVFDTIVCVNRNFNKPIDIKLRNLSIREIVVEGRQKVLQQNRDEFEIDVANTFLRDSRSVLDILRKSPGVLVDNNNRISIFGKENLAVFINDRQMRSSDELLSLSSNNIASIEVIRNPSGRYDGNMDAVIKINTKKGLYDKIDFAIQYVPYWGRKMSNDFNLSGGFYVGQIKNYIGYAYNDNHDIIYDKNDSYVYGIMDTTYSERKGRNDWKRRTHNVLYSLSYGFGDNITAELQYSGNISFDKNDIREIQSIRLGKQIDSISIHSFRKEKQYLHNIGLYFEYNLNKSSSLQVQTDYAISASESCSKIEEYYELRDENSDINFLYKDKYHIYSLRADFNSNFRGFEVVAGTKISYLYDDAMSNEIIDRNYAFYLMGKKQIVGFDFEGGLRLEKTAYRMNSLEMDGVRYNINRDYWNLYPNLKISRDISGSFSFSLGYSKKISRVAFYQLNPRYKYLDALSYNIGNPYLLPTYTHLLSLDFRVGDLLFLFEYNLDKNFISPASLLDEQTEMIKHTYINLNRAQFGVLNIIYQKNFRKLSNYISISMNKPYINVPYMSSVYKVRKPLWQIQYVANCQLWRNASLDLSFIYRSKGEKSTLNFDSFNNLSLGINQSFFNRKLLLSFYISDIFDMYKTNNWQERYGEIYTSMDSNKDSRKWMITLRYKFGLADFRFVKKSANTENINRR